LAERDRVCRANAKKNPKDYEKLPDLGVFYYVVKSFDCTDMWGVDEQRRPVALQQPVRKVARVAIKLTCKTDDPYNAVLLGYIKPRTDNHGKYLLDQNGYNCKGAQFTEKYRAHLKSMLQLEISQMVKGISYPIFSMIGTGYFTRPILQKQHKEIYANVFMAVLKEQLNSLNHIEYLFIAAPDGDETEAWTAALEKIKKENNHDLWNKIIISAHGSSFISTQLEIHQSSLPEDDRKSVSCNIAADQRGDGGHGFETPDCSSDEAHFVRSTYPVQFQG
jgi:hypothetical protein